MAACGQCGEKGAGRDGVCGACRLRAFGSARRLYAWTDELRAELREAYRLRKGPRAKAIDRLALQTGWPRKVFLLEAVRMGITTWQRKPWTPEEDALLREWVGEVGWATIARRLGRSKGSVQARSDLLRISRRPTVGYTLLMLHNVLGASNGLIKRWVERGLFGALKGGRVTEYNVLRFIRRYPQEYDLRRVDQTWYKAVLFGHSSEVA